MSATLVHTRPRAATWQGRAGSSWTIARVANPARTVGERVSVIRWNDDNTVTVTHLTGDGRRPDVQIHAKLEGIDWSDEQIIAWAEARLA